MKHKMLDLLIKAENIMGVYRTYSSQMKYRNIRIIRVILEELIFTVVLLSFTYDFFIGVRSGNINPYRLYIFSIFHYANFFCNLTIMVCVIQSSRSYKIFVQNLLVVLQCFNTEATNKRSRRFKNIFITTTVLLCIGGAFILPLRIFHKILVLNLPVTPGLVALFTTNIFAELRFSIEHVVFYIYISMIRCLLKCLNDYLSDLQHYYDVQEKENRVGRREANDPFTEEQMEAWATNYMLLVSCSKELSACFSFQMIFSLGLSSIHYISSSYAVFYMLLENETYKYIGVFQVVFVLMYSLCSTHLVLHAGQKLIKEATNTRTGLLKLNNTLSIYPTSKAIKNLCVLVKANPIKIEYTGGVVQGMCLIPIVLSLSIGYIIVALQFSHLI